MGWAFMAIGVITALLGLVIADLTLDRATGPQRSSRS